jgi:hypothetical protein
LAAVEKRGIPAVVFCTDAFEPLAQKIAASLGFAATVPLAVLAHPVAGLPDDDVAGLLPAVIPSLIAALTTDRGDPTGSTPALDGPVVDGDKEDGSSAAREAGGRSYLQLWEELEHHGYGDGLPLVPPSATAVDEMLGGFVDHRREVIGVIPPRKAEATYENVAANAVMAGCRPDYFAVVVTALRAMLADEFNLLAMQTTSHPAAPMLIVNGPMRETIGMNSGASCLGAGNRANATIGRAVRLALQNIGGARPGEGDRATHGHPGKYTYCFAENEAASPWDPLSLELGFPADVSTVTVVSAEAPHNVNDHSSTTATGVLTTMADTMATMGNNDTYVGFGRHAPVVLFGPEHAHTIAREGWSKTDVRRFLYENARKPLGKLKLGGMWTMREWPRWMEVLDDHALVPIVESASDFIIVVAGGEGKHSMYVPTIGVSRAATLEILTP